MCRRTRRSSSALGSDAGEVSLRPEHPRGPLPRAARQPPGSERSAPSGQEMATGSLRPSEEEEVSLGSHLCSAPSLADSYVPPKATHGSRSSSVASSNQISWFILSPPKSACDPVKDRDQLGP